MHRASHHVGWNHRLAAAFLGLGVLGGCSTPTGQDDGRRTLEDVSIGDRRSGAVLEADLMSFTDQASEFLAAQIANLQEVRTQRTRYILTIGDIVNGTQDTPSGDLDRAQLRLRDQLNRSELIRSRFYITNDRGRVRSMNARIRGEGPPDLLQEGWNSSNDPTRYKREVTYALSTELRESVRGNRRHYTAAFSLTRLDNGVIVLETAFDGSRVVE